MKDFIKENWHLILITGLGVWLIVWVVGYESPPPKKLSEILQEPTAILLTDADGKKYVAIHWSGDKWELHQAK